MSLAREGEMVGPEWLLERNNEPWYAFGRFRGLHRKVEIVGHRSGPRDLFRKSELAAAALLDEVRFDRFGWY